MNGEPQGVAARGLPSVLYAVIDLYGKCVKVTITHPVEREHNNDECLSCDSAEFDFECELFSNSLLDDFRNIRLQPRPNSNTGLPVPADELDTPISMTVIIDFSFVYKKSSMKLLTNINVRPGICILS